MTIAVRPIDGVGELNRVRQLCWDYRQFLIDRSEAGRHVVEALYPHDKYLELMERLDQVHARPKGAIYGAFGPAEMAGCGMSYEIAPGVAEIKRVFVAPEARGNGAGRALCEALIAKVRADGYETLMLDTLKTLHQARRLYANLGFRERGPFYDVPALAEGSVTFYEMTL